VTGASKSARENRRGGRKKKKTQKGRGITKQESISPRKSAYDEDRSTTDQKPYLHRLGLKKEKQNGSSQRGKGKTTKPSSEKGVAKETLRLSDRKKDHRAPAQDLSKKRRRRGIRPLYKPQ